MHSCIVREGMIVFHPFDWNDFSGSKASGMFIWRRICVDWEASIWRKLVKEMIFVLM